MGFEPTRAEHNGLAVHHLNHSATSSSSGLADKKPDSVIFPAFRFNRITEKLTINVPKHVGASIIRDYRCPHSKALTDEDGIRTHACRAQWISSPSP